jgi:transcriptional regulator with XRE-family HTH domain
MEPLAKLGEAIARLRNLYGLSLEECASRIEVPVERLAAMERGEIESADLGKIARLYALDEDGLREGMVSPVQGVEGATIFLLQGAYQDFDDRALGVLERAMRAARERTALDAASDEGRERLRRRLQFVPTAPAGPRRLDAALQGYKLARMVRARLNLGGEPIEDIRELLEDQLGIAVVMENLIGRDLRAASIVDLHRAAAAAVLASRHADFRTNRVLARVYFAHESCHVLFDPGAPGSVRIALDALHPQGSAGSTSNGDELLESRAKGFAAELLIPLAGVNALLGAPAAPESSLARARRMVARVREHFFTPWEITVHHLQNLGFVAQELKVDLLEEERRVDVGWSPARNRLLERLRRTRPAPDVAAGAASDSAATSRQAPRYVREARQAAEAAIEALNANVIAKASEAVEHGRPVQAVHLLMEHFDDLFHAGEFAAARRALERIDPRRFPRRVLVGVLTVTRHARDQLGHTRVEFLTRVESALADTWQLSPKDIAAIARRLA